MKLIIKCAYLLTYLQSISFQTTALRCARRINSQCAMILSILLIAHGLPGCYTLHSTTAPSLEVTPTIPDIFLQCEPNQPESQENHATDDWIEALMLAPLARKKALNIVETPSSNQQIWSRVFLLTHDKASYRELREAEQLLLNKLNSKHIESREYGSQALHDYMLKLNLYFQKNKSEVVLLQRQLNARDRSIKTQKLVNEVLENKIEALTNIEQRMKRRPNKIKPKVTP